VEAIVAVFRHSWLCIAGYCAVLDEECHKKLSEVKSRDGRAARHRGDAPSVHIGRRCRAIAKQGIYVAASRTT